MTDVAQQLAAFRASGDLDGLVQAIPYLRFLGCRFDTGADGQLTACMPYGDHLVGNASIPALHGGTLGALLEVAAIVQVLWASPEPVLPRTINLTVEYLRSGRPVDTFARGTITRHGRRVIHVRAEAWQDDPARPIALGHVHVLGADSDR